MADELDFYDAIPHIQEKNRESIRSWEPIVIIRTTLAASPTANLPPDSAKADSSVLTFDSMADITPIPLAETLQPGGAVLRGDHSILSRVKLYGAADPTKLMDVEPDVILFRGMRWRISQTSSEVRIHGQGILWQSTMHLIGPQ